MLGWFETKVTAGANSKGEVRFTSKGEIFVDKKGNFKFTKKPTFQNEHLLGNNWMVEIGLVEGISWAHGDERKTDWHGSVQIPQADLLKQINFFEELPWLPGIDFICVRPIMYYEHDGKSYRYQWEGFVKDIFYPPKADSLKTIDISNPSQVSKICGTWVFRTSWTDENYQIYDSVVPMKVNQTKTLTIDAQNLEIKIIEIVTKKDSGMFTEEEVKFHVDNSNRSTTISDDKKALTQEWYEERDTLSEFVAGWENDSYTIHYELKLFEDKELGDELRVIGSGKDNGQDYEFCDTYRKQ